MQAVYEQISENLQSGGVAQGSNFWNLYSVGVGSDDPYQVTLADTSTMAVIGAHVRSPCPSSLPLDMQNKMRPLCTCLRCPSPQACAASGVQHQAVECSIQAVECVFSWQVDAC